MHLLLYCSQLLWPSHCDSCYFGFRNSYFDSEVMIIAVSTDCWISTTILPFLPTWRWSFLRVLMSGKARRQALSPQQSSPDGEILYSSLLMYSSLYFSLKILNNSCQSVTDYYIFKRIYVQIGKYSLLLMASIY